MSIVELLDLPDQFVEGLRLVNLVLALILLAIALIGLFFMRGRPQYSCSGRYALYGLAALTFGGVVAALGNFIPGEQEVLSLMATALRVTAIVYLVTHVVFNIKVGINHQHTE